MKPATVIHAVPTLDPARGGPPVVVVSLAAAQAAAGMRVVVAHQSDAESSERIDKLLGATPGIDQVEIAAGSIAALVHDYASQKDTTLLHMHGFWEPPLFRAASAARKTGIPYVLTPHGMLHPWCLSQKRLKKWVALRLGYGAMLRQASLIHALNATERDIVAALSPQPPIAVIPNGVYLESLTAPSELGTFRAKHPAIGDRPLVLFMSRLHFKKGLDVLTAAFASALKRRPELRLVVLGPDDGYSTELNRQITQLGVQQEVLVPGPIYGDEKLAALYDADCFCLPSRQEGFSIAITEALGCGTPCVVSRDCNYPEITEVDAGVETSLDPEEVADAILEVLADPATTRRRGEAGRRLVEERFTWDRVANTSIEAYQQIDR